MKSIRYMKRIGGVIAIVCSLLVAWTLAYWLTSLLYRAFNFYPSDFVNLLINSSIGLLIFFGFLFLLTRNPWVRNKQMQSFYPIIEAMKMIAEGNFKVDLSVYMNQFQQGDEHHPFYQIVENFNHMITKLGEMEEMRQEFISNVSHEIQSPLTSISGFAHALKNESLTAQERQHYLDIIEMESQRLSKLSENLLKLTSLESEHLLLDHKSYRLDYQLRRIILANEPQWIKKMLNMEVSLEKLTITADEDLMEQVWINLIHNSIKFTPEGGTIAITAKQSADGGITVTIRDTGIGIEQEHLVHIFERFYKADQSRNRSAGGSGLGLSIVKKIIDLHQGDIEVQSKLGAGTEFTIKLALVE